MKKTFAQLKRDFKVGATIETVLNNCRPEKNGQIRKIKKTQSNAIVFEDLTHNSGDSWLWWGKASDYEYEDNTVKVYHEYKGERFLDFIYKIIRTEAE